MKGYVRIGLLSLLLMLGSCEKEAETALAVNARVLKGTWQFRGMFGGNVAFDPNVRPTGKAQLWVFGDSTYQYIDADTVSRQGIYAVSSGTGIDLNTNRVVDQFIFDGVPAQSFELRNDTLRIYYGIIAADGYINFYTKVKD